MAKMDCEETLKLGKYELKGTIGNGSFGKVKLAKDTTTGDMVAVKMISRSKMKLMKIVAKLKREIEMVSTLKHPNIIKLYEVLSTPTDVCLVMEYVTGGELFDYLLKVGCLSVKESRHFFQQIISAVDYCHRQGIVHRDLKPENILLDFNNNLKIIDFGLANRLLDGQLMSTSCGSPNYASPELVSGVLYSGPEVDIWSCGVILYVFLTGRLPFDDDKIQMLFKKIKTGCFYIPTTLEPSVVNLMRSMLRPDPVKRATINDIISDEWFKVDLPIYLFPPLDDFRFDPVLLVPDLITKLAQIYDLTYENVQNRLLDDSDPRDVIKMAYIMLHDDSNRIRNINSFDSGYRGSIPSNLDSLVSDFREKMNILSVSGRLPVRCESHGQNGVSLPLGQQYCNADCNLCPKLGASECVFNKKLPTLTGCDNCSVAKKDGCAYSFKEPGGVIEELRNNSITFGKKVEQKPEKVGVVTQVNISHRKSIRRAKWHLGIRSPFNADKIMAQVYIALKNVNMEWFAKTPYHLIARRKCINKESQDQKPITIGLQLYKADSKVFLLDLQDVTDKYELDETIDENLQSRITPSETMLFLDLCAAIIKKLAKK